MDQQDDDDDDDDEFYRGAGLVSLIFVEVVPLLNIAGTMQNVNDNHNNSNLTNVFVKKFLWKISHSEYHTMEEQISFSESQVPTSGMEIEWSVVGHDDSGLRPHEGSKRKNSIHGRNCNQDLALGYLSWTGGGKGRYPSHRVIFGTPLGPQESCPICFLPANDPSEFEPVRCVIRAYGSRIIGMKKEGMPTDSSQRALVTSSTLVRILPPRPPLVELNVDPICPLLMSDPLGDAGLHFLTSELHEEVLGNHDLETVRALSLRMSMQIGQDIHVGTTHDAFRLRQKRHLRIQRMGHAIRERFQRPSSSSSQISSLSTEMESSTRSIPWEASLLLHSPNHGDGKTLLVQAVAQKIGCSRIHLIRSGPLLAQYGIYADAALESILHGIVVSAAMQSQPVCIILDHLDTMMPPQASGRSAAGDAAMPVLNAIASYLRMITISMEQTQEFPFPVKNSMYNLGGSGGRVLSARLCLVGIVTCPDDGWRSVMAMGNSGLATTGTTILDSMQGGRYRLPSLSATTRWRAFSGAFQRTNLVLDESARKRLPILAASTGWAKGRAFERVATVLSSERHPIDEATRPVSMKELERAFSTVQAVYSDFGDVSFQSAPQEGNNGDLFASVGGNLQAKESLEDALALEPEKRQMLARFGMSMPTGILLYGPPGCGKTLLAKAVVRLLKSPIVENDSPVPLGGTFISLGSSDLVRAEIGTSEKMLVSAFHFADKNAPSVIFLDEFQALFTERSRGGSGKLASTLLQCMDDIKRWNAIDETSRELGQSSSSSSNETMTNRVVVLGATNTPWMVDSAFLRSGRFDRVVHVGLPTLAERESILRVHISRMKMKDVSNEDSLRTLCHSIAERTDGFSGADIAALCRAAAIRTLGDGGGEDCSIEERHIWTALEKDVRASSDAQLVDRLKKWKP